MTRDDFDPEIGEAGHGFDLVVPEAIHELDAPVDFGNIHLLVGGLRP